MLDDAQNKPIVSPVTSEINWEVERRRLLTEELYPAADIIILSLTTNPKNAWNIKLKIHDQFGTWFSPGTLYSKLQKLIEDHRTIRWKEHWDDDKRCGNNESKLCLSLGPEKERFFLESMEARRRVLSYAVHKPFENKIIDLANPERGEKLVKKLTTKYAKRKIQPLILSRLLEKPNYALAMRREIESGLDVKLNDATVSDALNDLLKRGLVKYAVPECPTCGKPEGWVFDSKTGRPQRFYDSITNISGKYYALSMMTALDVSYFLLKSYEDQVNNPVDLTDWPHLKPEQLRNKL